MSDTNHHGTSSSRLVLAAIAAALVLYAVAVAFGWPQWGAEQIVSKAEHGEAHDDGELHGAAHGDGDEAVAGQPQPPPFYTVIPFALLLGAIAVLPLLKQTEHWWEHNRNRFLVAASLAGVTLLYYLALHDQPVELHYPGHATVEPSEGGLSFAAASAVLQNAILGEYIPFIVLLFSLYAITGGIRIQGDLPAHPLTNATMLAIGGLLASFVGTTGAAMLLIRVLLETNSERKHVAHTVVFFIFVVCNCGGCLLPIGDPPLFLGYLQGVPFFWTMELWAPWLLTNALLIGMYWAADQFYYYRKETLPDIIRDETRRRRIQISGAFPNALLLVGVIFSVALLDPSKTFPGTDWHPWLYLREVVQLALIAASLLFGSERVRYENRFNYHPIVEVAALFFGIFICMQPALAILDVHGGRLGIVSPAQYFWATGGLSAVLDNAPTYLVFFKTAQAVGGEDLVAGVQHDLLVAISLGAVFMGAMTYIGNGPNFMVKAIAEKSGVRMPSFFGYVGYSVVALLPIFALITWLFLWPGAPLRQLTH
jgi:Na+/H+ antiporter NhaD/arsenite permease-like protein